MNSTISKPEGDWLRAVKEMPPSSQDPKSALAWQRRESIPSDDAVEDEYR